VFFRRTAYEPVIDREDGRTIIWLLADIRTEPEAIHTLLVDDDGEEAAENS